MANTLSNLYVEKASSEHPLALWTLNEQVDYISHISDEEREIYLFVKWEIENAEATPYPGTALASTPFPSSPVTKLEGLPPGSLTEDIVLRSKFSITDQLVDKFYNFAMGAHIYMQSELSNSVSLGYQYFDPGTSQIVEVLRSTPTRKADVNGWKFYSNTLDLPPSDAQDVRYLIKVNVSQGGLEEAYNFYVNGVTVGQWSEDFMETSYGIAPEQIPSNIAIPTTFKAIPAFPYGTSGDNGYYLARDYELVCKNFGVPLVYGSAEVTKIYPNSLNGVDYPSLIFPGYGFLNERGRHNDYTVELWLRINSAAPSTRKIFGPIVGKDGLYVDDSFLTLKIGNTYGSHFVGEWYRPMLIHIRVSNNSAILILNGEEVVNIAIEQETLDLPAEIVDGKSQDWVGVYAYADVPLIDIDSFSIYSYGIPTQVAKRRWVWGQAVSAPEQTNSAINAVTAFNDYSFANYAANYNYPDFANFKQAFFSNVDAESKSLRLPDYSLPDFRLSDRNVQELFDGIAAIPSSPSDSDDVAGRKYLTLGLDPSTKEYLYFKELNVLSDPVQTVYGVFKTDGTGINQPLLKVSNKNTGDYILVSVNGIAVTYATKINGVTTVFATKTIEANKKFTAGLNLKSLADTQIIGINRFFSDASSLDLYVAGDSSAKFSGKIYKVGFDGAYNNKKNVNNLVYDTSGVFYSTESIAEIMYNHTANYTLVAVNKYDVFFADIAVAGYWEDYMPLSYFAKYVLDSNGDKQYDLDMIQFNLDFPEPNSQSIVEQTSLWTYAQLRAAYNSPTQLLYRDLNNKFYTKWENYQDMNENTIKTIYFNTERSTVRSYVSFQNVADGANKNLVDFTNQARPLANGLVDPDGVSYSWEDTAYELTTGTLIYPPKSVQKMVNNLEKTVSVDFNDLAIVYHLEFKSEGILHQPIRIKDLQLASQVFERTKLTPVGSKFGVPVYYYSKSGFYFDLKGKNPIATYKKSTPHLYLNRQSGWKLKGDFDIDTDRGLAMPINEARALKTEVSSVQLWVRFSEKEFPGERVKIFSIDHNNGIYDFYIQADSSLNRGEVFALDRDTGEQLYSFKYFVNGRRVNTPYLVQEEWTVIGIEFPDLLDFSGRAGSFSLNGPLTYNNVSYNLATNLEKDESIEARVWAELLTVHKATVSNASSQSGSITYTSSKPFQVGEIVTITGATPSEYNIINAEVTAASQTTFTIAGTISVPYSAGGEVTSSSWAYAKTDLVVSDNSIAPYSWKNVKVYSQERNFNIDPEAIYNKYTGSDRVIVDDESRGILFKPEQFKLHNEVVWKESVKTPV